MDVTQSNTDTESPWITAAKSIPYVGAVVGLGASLFKAAAAKKQLAEAERLNPTNPGYQLNYGVIDNAKNVADAYGNYTLPGQTQLENQVNNNYSSGFASGSAGATSGGDLLDLAAKLTYGKNQQNNQIAVEQAQGKQDMLGQFLTSQAAAGQEYQNKNAYDRGEYDKILKQKAALNQAGNENMYGVIDQVGSALGAYLNPKKVASDNTLKTVTPGSSIFGTNSGVVTGGTNPYGSIDINALKKILNTPS